MNSPTKSIQYWIMCDSHIAIAVGSNEFGVAAPPKRMGSIRRRKTAIIMRRDLILDIF